MDENYLKPYRITLKTISPVHIGSGAKLYRSADFITTKDDKLIVLDENRLIEWIAGRPDSERLANIFASYLRDSQKGIQEFLKLEPMKSQLSLSTVQAYSLKHSGRPRDVLVFIKDDEHQPYIPGSSLKGALRSALLRGDMIGDLNLKEFAQKMIMQGAEKKKTNSGSIEARLFAPSAQSIGKVPNFDIHRTLVIRDSEGVPIDKLQVALIKVLSTNKQNKLSWKKARNSYDDMEIYAEVLSSKTILHFEVVWQTHLLSQKAAALGFQKAEHLLAFLPEYCRIASQNLLIQERDFYERHGQPELREWFEKRLNELSSLPENIFYLPLGWGSGYDAKTITDLLDGETFKTVVNTFRNTKGLGKPGNNEKEKWLGAADSPKSRKVVVQDSGSYPLGWVEVHLDSPVDQNDWLSAERKKLDSKKPHHI